MAPELVRGQLPCRFELSLAGGALVGHCLCVVCGERGAVTKQSAAHNEQINYQKKNGERATKSNRVISLFC